ncbi:MAG: succinate dehydrogenase, hydrophobic membrane anchor protein, partial [Caulobacteraceae bacterium]
MVSYRTGLSRARGLGSAKHGASHWVMERVTSIALIPLVLWAVYSGFTLAVTDYAGAVLWAGHPVNAVLLILLLAVSFIHMHAGLRVVIEDYIHTPGSKIALSVLNLFVCGFAGAIAV